MQNKIPVIITTTALLSFSVGGYAQAPPLGTASGFFLFSTNGAVGNTGISQVTGNFGTLCDNALGWTCEKLLVKQSENITFTYPPKLSLERLV